MTDKSASYPEWKDLEKIIDENNPFSSLYRLSSGELFYVEPLFYTQLSNLFVMQPNVKEKVLKAIIEIVKKEKKVIFTHDYEHPLTKNNDFILREIEDVLDPLLIFVEDKSRGDNYGD